jgi:hypothetical protein
MMNDNTPQKTSASTKQNDNLVNDEKMMRSKTRPPALQLSNTRSTLSSDSFASSGDEMFALSQSDYQTPRARENYLASLFENKSSAPSPPKKNGIEVYMTEEEIDHRISELWLIPSLLSEENYAKVAWLIAKGVDEVIKQNSSLLSPACVKIRMVLSPWTSPGKIFHALYHGSGDKRFESLEEVGIRSLEELLAGELKMWDIRHADHNNASVDEKTVRAKEIYSIYDDPKHPNMKPHYRMQEGGTCYVHAAANARLVKGLFCNPDVDLEEADMVHTSKFLRDTLSPKGLYDHIFNDSGGSALVALDALFPNTGTTLTSSIQLVDCQAPFETIKECLQQHGPAVLGVFEPTDEFYNEDVFVHTIFTSFEKPKTHAGHALLLVGVLLDMNDQVHFLFQNSWAKKSFLSIQQHYLPNLDPHKFYFVKNDHVSTKVGQLYAQTVGTSRCVVASKLLGRPNIEPKCR